MSRTIIVANGMCAAIRPQVLTALKPYGFNPLHVESYAQTEDGRRAEDGATLIGNDRPLCNVAEVTVSSAAARWCEYVLLRSKRFSLMSRPLDERNEVWAAKWNTLPRAWSQAGCSTQAPQQHAPSAPPARANRQRMTRTARRQSRTRRQVQRDSGLLDTLRGWLR